MHIYLITIGEPLPTDGTDVKLLRHGLLANELIKKGHQVTWWTATFNHALKKQRYDSDTTLRPHPLLTIHCLHSVSYKKNVSFLRIINHAHLAIKFYFQAKKLPSRPDLILCSFPPIELSALTVFFGKKYSIPTIIDVRDLWPDVFLNAFPQSLKLLAHLTLKPFELLTSYALRNASSLMSISDGYMEWSLAKARRKRKKSDSIFFLGYKEKQLSVEDGDRKKNELAVLGVDTTKSICLFTGTFGKSYDIPTIIDAARKLEQKGNATVQFVLCGTGENMDQYKTKAHGLKNIVFTGWIDSQDIAVLLSLATIGMMSYAASAKQGLPNKLFEYLAAGLPIVSSLEGETATLLRECTCGISYKAGDPDGFIVAIETILQNMDLSAQMKHSARTLFKQKFSADTIYTELVTYLETYGTTQTKRN